MQGSESKKTTIFKKRPSRPDHGALTYLVPQYFCHLTSMLNEILLDIHDFRVMPFFKKNIIILCLFMLQNSIKYLITKVTLEPITGIKIGQSVWAFYRIDRVN